MVIKTSWILLLIGVGLPAALSSQDISENWNNASEIREQRKIQARQDRQATMHATQARQDSEIALTRVKAGCVPVVAKSTLKQTHLAEGVEVIASRDSTIPLGDGSLICTRLGDTAEIWGGRVSQVKRIAPDNVDSYLDYFSKQPGAH